VTRLVYVAEPIDQSTAEPRKILCPDEWTLFRPSEAFQGAQSSLGPSVGIERVNRKVLAAVDGLLAFLPQGVPTIGVPAEIEWALLHGVPTVIVTDNEESVAIAGFEDRGAVVVAGRRLGVSELDKLMASETTMADTLGFVRTSPEAQLPSKGYEDDAGLDLYAAEDLVIRTRTFTDVPCGVVANLPPGTWGLIVGRSSTLRNHGLWVFQGVIDASFRGELLAGVWNPGPRAHHVKVGDRLAQLIVLPASPLRPVWADAIVPGASARGRNGFGSTGA